MGQSFQEIKNIYLCKPIHHWFLSSAWVLEKFVCDLKTYWHSPCILLKVLCFFFTWWVVAPRHFAHSCDMLSLFMAVFFLFVCEKNRFSSRDAPLQTLFFQWQSFCLSHLTVLSSQAPWIALLEWLLLLWRTVVWCHNVSPLNVYLV